MPEIPEVEAYKEVIKKHCLKKKIEEIGVQTATVLKKITIASFKKKLTDHNFKAVERRGKYLIITVGDSSDKLVMHFGLTGFLLFTKDKQEKVSSSRVQFIFNKAVLHWINQRKFGKLWLVEDITSIKAIRDLGPDPLKLSQKNFLALLADHEPKNIKSLLMDQKIVAGIGNEYADEILFQAGIDPRHKVQDLAAAVRVTLYKKMKLVLKYAIRLRIKDIEHHPEQRFLGKADRATFKSSYLQAHRHVDMICPKNKKHRLKKIVVNGRTTYFCPLDQK